MRVCVVVIVPAEHSLFYELRSLCSHFWSPMFEYEVRFSIFLDIGSGEYSVVIVVCEVIHEFLVVVVGFGTASA